MSWVGLVAYGLWIGDEGSDKGGRAMSDFKGRHIEGEIVLCAVRWYRRYGISYRYLEQMVAENCVSVDHQTVFRWLLTCAPEIEKRPCWQ